MSRPNLLERTADMDDISDLSESHRFLTRDSSDEMDDSYCNGALQEKGFGGKICRKSCWRTLSTCQILITCVIVFPLGVLLGSAIPYLISVCSSRQASYGGLLAPAGTITEVWQHNLTFSGAPSPETEAAWASIVPVGRGFITQPEIAPFISNIAAFHQLHCLHAIQVAYYAAANSSTNAEQTIELFGTRVATPHVRHCFDYLRRSIMCAADTNLEVVDRLNHTTNGWGQEKKCRDWNQIFQYAERYANSTDKGIVT